jgi:DNA invertase Pin-like site-specific DNA recombinase
MEALPKSSLDPVAAGPRAYSYIRMSTDMQLKGDSLRRQTEQTRRYVEEHGLELAEDDALRDIGVSAFKGANIASGALGLFLAAVRSNKVERGSFLIVESLDRISRQEVMTSLAVFTEIVNSGINIVTLADGHVYLAGKTDFQQLIYSVVVMSRAHEESQMKSHRLSAAWKNKRNTVGERKLTAMCPGWLRLSADKRSFTLIPERVEIVRTIFSDSAAGMGTYTIARRLNESCVPPFGKSNGWQLSSVNKILGSRAVLGEFQPHKIVDGERLPEGEPIRDYFPTIVDENLFYRVHAARQERRLNGRGRKGQSLSNLFTGLAKCGYCGAQMHFVNKGGGPKGGTYLVCDAGRRGVGCDNTSWRYEQFETSFLAFVEELDLEQIVRGEEDVLRRAAIDEELEETAGRIGTLERQRERTYALYLNDESPSQFLIGKLKECESALAIARNERERLEHTRDEAKGDASRFYESKDQIRALITRFKTQDVDEVYRLRSQIASRLRTLIASLVVCPAGGAPLTRQAAGLAKDDPELQDFFREELADARAHRRYFLIAFKDKTVRAVYPSPDNPLRFDEQLVRGASGSERLTQEGTRQKIFKVLTSGAA